MTSPLSGIKTEVENELRRQQEESVRLHRPYANSILQDLRLNMLEAVREGKEDVFVMSWEWVLQSEERIEGLPLQCTAARVPMGSELLGAERLVYDECVKEGLRVRIEAPELAEDASIRYLHMYVKIRN
ncbi:MAG: hypothetical protein K2X77_06910 [Candidatus Obscuribacterales bacterium]|jgi:3-methyladenine DNA glycosylase AlkC|nr:hypothetical protein [Candidatus Obscuribacterales bacterium]